MDHDPLRRGFAEFVGTFTLIFIGAGSILTLDKLLEPATNGQAQALGVYGSLTLVSVAFAHGLAIAVMVSAVGHISGGHFNPAVTFGFLITRRLAPTLALVYWSVQLLGAPSLAGGINVWQGVVIEGVLTFFLVWVVFATAADPGGTFKSIAGLAIGLTITLDIYMGGPYTGAAMNPARAFGPDLVQNIWSDAWVWWVGPLAGGALAALLYEYLYLRPVSPEPVGPPETGLDEPVPGDAAAM